MLPLAIIKPRLSENCKRIIPLQGRNTMLSTVEILRIHGGSLKRTMEDDRWSSLKCWKCYRRGSQDGQDAGEKVGEGRCLYFCKLIKSGFR